MMFTVIVTLGQAIFMVGGYMSMKHPSAGFSTMIAGRIVFGFGGESMTVA